MHTQSKLLCFRTLEATFYSGHAPSCRMCMKAYLELLERETSHTTVGCRSTIIQNGRVQVTSTSQFALRSWQSKSFTGSLPIAQVGRAHFPL